MCGGCVWMHGGGFGRWRDEGGVRRAKLSFFFYYHPLLLRDSEADRSQAGLHQPAWQEPAHLTLSPSNEKTEEWGARERGRGEGKRRGENESLTTSMREGGEFIRFLPRKAINETSCLIFIHVKVLLSFILSVCVCACTRVREQHSKRHAHYLCHICEKAHLICTFCKNYVFEFLPALFRNINRLNTKQPFTSVTCYFSHSPCRVCDTALL